MGTSADGHSATRAGGGAGEARGDEVVITRHDKVVARLVPEGPRRLDEVRRAVSGLRELQNRIRRRTKAKL